MLMYFQPYHNVVITNSSFSQSESSRPISSAYILPSFKYISDLPRDYDSLQALVRGYLLPTRLNPAHDVLSSNQRDKLLRSKGQRNLIYGHDVKDVLILICGHGERDLRCGITGPVLRDTFNSMLRNRGIEVLDGPVDISEEPEGRTARVGLISHIGGHKFAGNVILYIPPGTKTKDGDHALAGCGIWYGRVEPKHIEGIIKETILGGRIIEDLFRGGIRQGGEILRL